MCDVKEKFCKGCETIKPLDEFGVQKLGKYGRRSKCHICRRSEVNAKRNTDEGKAHRKAYRHRNRDKVNAKKRLAWSNMTEEQKSKEAARKKTPEYREAHRIRNSRYSKIISNRNIEDLIKRLRGRGVCMESPYILYHFKIGNIFKFGITKYTTLHRYRSECDLELIEDLREYVMGKRDAIDLEKIVWNKTRDSMYFGESPFRNTGVFELRTEDSTKLIESLINEMNFELIKV